MKINNKVAVIFFLAIISAGLASLVITDYVTDKQMQKDLEIYKQLSADLKGIKNEVAVSIKETETEQKILMGGLQKEIDELAQMISESDSVNKDSQQEVVEGMLGVANLLMERHNQDYLNWINQTEYLVENAYQQGRDSKRSRTTYIIPPVGSIS